VSDTHLYTRDRDGVTVYLLHRIWFGKILPKHIYLEGLEQYVRRTVEEPAQINEDAQYDSRKCFYRHFRLAGTTSTDEYLKVVVDYSQNDYGELEGRIISAYTCDKIKDEEVKLWPSDL